MTKIGRISPYRYADMTIYYDDKAQRNPYRVYLEWRELGQYGVTKRKRQVERYADLHSCMELLYQYVQGHNEEGRPRHNDGRGLTAGGGGLAEANGREAPR